MAVLLKDAMQPNLVQTLENNPAFVHGGPFANIAHGCNSVIATTTALKLADYVVTEAGFGADLGAEKFFDIKCRKAGLKPAAAVIVATVRALKMNGGVAKDDLGTENVEAVKKGCANLGRHIENVQQFGVPAVVAINHFISDTEAEIAGDARTTSPRTAPRRSSASTGPRARPASRSWRTRSSSSPNAARSQFAPLYPDDMPLFDKIKTIAKRIYRADEAIADKSVRDQLHAWEEAGYGNLPVCMAKTQYSLLDRPEPARRADRPHRAGPRGPAVGRRRLRRRDLRRDHDHARPAARALRRDDPAERGRADRGLVLGGAGLRKRCPAGRRMRQLRSDGAARRRRSSRSETRKGRDEQLA